MDERNERAAFSSLECLLDANSFVETGCHVRHNSVKFGIDKQTDGDGVIAGYGTIGAVPVYVYVQDMDAFDGSVGEKNAQKIARIYDAAVKNGVPVISVLNSKGARLKEGVAALDGYAKIMKSAARAAGTIPRICVVTGPAIGAASVIAQMSDFVFVTDEAQLTATSAEVRKAAFGEGEKVYGYAYDFKGSMEQIAENISKLLTYIPMNSMEDAPVGDQSDDFNRIIAYSDDVRTLIANAADFGEFLELKKDASESMITGFARFGGFTAGVVANEKGARLDCDGLAKAAAFVSYLDSFNIPVISLVDAEGFVYCNCEEECGLSKRAAALAYAYASSGMPMITVLAGNAIGAAYCVMGSKELGADMVYAFNDAVVAPLDEEQASVIFYDELEGETREDKKNDYKKKYADPMQAAYLGSIDRVIEKGDLRQMLISALMMQASKHAGEPLKRHGNLPL